MSKKDTKEEIEYDAPEVQTLGTESPAVEVVDTAPAEVNRTSLPGTVIPESIGISRMLKINGNEVTDVLVARIAQHLEFTVGDKGLADREERANEQGGFINTVLASLELDFEKYVVFTDYLLTQLRANAEAIRSGKLLRHMGGLSESYDKEKVRKYTVYISFLTRVALNWNIRYKLDSLIDVNLFVSNFSEKGGVNISTYFHNLQNT